MRSILKLTFFVFLLSVNLIHALDKQKDCKCRIQSSKRIINGRNAENNAYPWQISIQSKDPMQVPRALKPMLPDSYKVGRHSCGAVLINENWVLSAGHCLPDSLSSSQLQEIFRIGYGSNDLVKIYDGNNYVDIEATYVHPDFGAMGDGAINDIALIKLKTPLEFNKMVQPACLPSKSVDLYDGFLKITGWGSIKTLKGTPYELEQAEPTRYLKEAETFDSTHDQQMCYDRTEEQICVENPKSREAPCKGDSGGPMHQEINGKTTVIGVTSWADVVRLGWFNIELCAGPTAYTRISSYMKWIEKHIGKDYCTA